LRLFTPLSPRESGRKEKDTATKLLFILLSPLSTAALANAYRENKKDIARFLSAGKLKLALLRSFCDTFCVKSI
jgi:hypothetical protein